MTTFAFWASSIPAISKPIPRLPPVTTKTLSARLKDSLPMNTPCDANVILQFKAVIYYFRFLSCYPNHGVVEYWSNGILVVKG
jgi:hypothetical protein